MGAIFVAGATGFIGRTFIDVARAADLELRALTRNQEAAERLTARRVRAVMGDLLEPGEWQREAADCEFAVYIAGPPTWGRRLSRRVAEQYRDGATAMTDAFYRSLNPDRLRQSVYVAGASYYGDTGAKPAVEEQEPIPRGTGPFIAPAIDLAHRYGEQGIPTIVTHPGAVYGTESWLPQLILEPLQRGKMIPSVKGYDPAISVIHVEDCARSLLHLLCQGKAGEDYFLADDMPVTLGDIVGLASGITGLTPKMRAFPRWLSRLVIGPILTDAAAGNVVVSNQKLKGTGFNLAYPTMREGLPPVIQKWKALQRSGNG